MATFSLNHCQNGKTSLSSLRAKWLVIKWLNLNLKRWFYISDFIGNVKRLVCTIVHNSTWSMVLFWYCNLAGFSGVQKGSSKGWGWSLFSIYCVLEWYYWEGTLAESLHSILCVFRTGYKQNKFVQGRLLAGWIPRLSLWRLLEQPLTYSLCSSQNYACTWGMAAWAAARGICENHQHRLQSNSKPLSYLFWYRIVR